MVRWYYKRLAEVERGFRTLNGVDLNVRPIRHRLESRVKVHIFLGMPAYHAQWHLRQAWQPLLFTDGRVRKKSRTAIPWRQPNARRPRWKKGTPVSWRAQPRR